ncbi:MAG: EamA family transporter, partial [Phaeodactylibacter sp.]|nr:EamA family transporter [Phaeodactylibacter sp.]
MNATSSSPKTETEQEGRPDLLSWGILILLSLIWGSSYILIKKGLVVFSSIELACLRLGISALCFLPFLIYQLRKVDWSRWPYLVIVGLTGTAIPAFMFAIAQKEISSSMAGVLSALVPLFTLTLGVLLFGMKAHWLKLLGVMVGLAGAASLILFSEEAEMGGNPWYGLLVIVGCICYAINSNTIAKYLRDMKALIISAASFSIVGVPAFLYIFQTDVVSKLESTPGAWEALGYVVLLSVMGTVIASIVFFQLIK